MPFNAGALNNAIDNRLIESISEYSVTTSARRPPPPSPIQNEHANFGKQLDKSVVSLDDVVGNVRKL